MGIAVVGGGMFALSDSAFTDASYKYMKRKPIKSTMSKEEKEMAKIKEDDKIILFEACSNCTNNPNVPQCLYEALIDNGINCVTDIKDMTFEDIFALKGLHDNPNNVSRDELLITILKIKEYPDYEVYRKRYNLIYEAVKHGESFSSIGRRLNMDRMVVSKIYHTVSSNMDKSYTTLDEACSYFSGDNGSRGTRAYNVLKRAGINTLEDLIGLSDAKVEELKYRRDCGKVCMHVIKQIREHEKLRKKK